MKKVLKRALIALMAVTALLGVVACNTGVKKEVGVVIGAAATEISAGESVTLTATVTGADDKTVTWSTSDPDVLAVTQEGVVTVVAAPAEDKVVSVYATANADATKKAAHQFTVAKGKALTISLNKKVAEIREGETVQLIATVTNAEETGVIWTSSDEKMLAVSEDGLVSVVTAPSVDMTINVTATAKADANKKVSCTFYLKKKFTQGEVGDLTAEMIEQIGNASITVSGRISDIYENFVTPSESESYEYEMTVQMQDGKWSSVHKIVDDRYNEFASNYLRGENTVTNAAGKTGYALLESYVDRHNQAVIVPVTDGSSVPAVWEEQHLYNHLGQLDVNKFEFDAQRGAYRYKIERKNEYGDNYYDENGKEDMTKPAVIDTYLMLYLGVSLTPIIDPSLGETVDVFYFYVEDGRINKIYLETNRQYSYSSDDKQTAVHYLAATLNLTEVGTTEVGLIKPYEGPKGTTLDNVPLRTLLNNALEEMKNAKSYTYSLKDEAIYTPQPDGGDYELSANVAYPMSTGTTVHNGTYETGTVGSIAYVTENAVLFKDTMRYTATLDGKAYRVTYHGYKQIDDGSVSAKPYYDEFEYAKDSDGQGTPAMVGTKRVYGTIKENMMPAFDFSADIFRYSGSYLNGKKYVYKFALISDRVTKDVAVQMSKYTYAKNATSNAEVRLELIVDEDGHLVETVFPYELTRGDVGRCTSTYSNIGTTELPEGVFNDYVERVWRTEWNQYQTKYYYPNHTSAGWTTEASTVNSETVMRAIFKDDYDDLIAPGVLLDIFGDNIGGPFFDWREVEIGGETAYYDYVSVTTRSQNVDANAKITDYDEIMAALDEKLGAFGYKRSLANCGVSGGDRVVTYIKNNVLIVVENNYTSYFWIYFRRVNEWSLN